MSSIIPNTTPWTLLVEVFVDATSEGERFSTQYPLTGWRIDEEGAHPIVCGEPYERGAVLFGDYLHGYSLHALMDPRTGMCRELGGGDECTLDDLLLVGVERANEALLVRRQWEQAA